MKLIEALRDYRNEYDTFEIIMTTGIIDSRTYGESLHEIAGIMCRNPEEVDKCIEYLAPYWDKPLRLGRPEIRKREDKAGGKPFTVKTLVADIVLNDGDDLIRLTSTEKGDTKEQEDTFPTLRYTGKTVTKYSEQEELEKVRKQHEEAKAFRKMHEEEERREKEEREKAREQRDELLRQMQMNKMTEEEKAEAEKEAERRAEETRRKAEAIRQKETEEEKKRMQEATKKANKKRLEEYREKTEEELIAEDEEFDPDEWFK